MGTRIVLQNLSIMQETSILVSPLFTGISSFLVGQIIHSGLSISETFQAFSIYCSGAATVFYLIYLFKGRKLESVRIEKVEKERAAEMGSNEEDNDEDFKTSSYL